jgi:hypothetical protein
VEGPVEIEWGGLAGLYEIALMHLDTSEPEA